MLQENVAEEQSAQPSTSATHSEICDYFENEDLWGFGNNQFSEKQYSDIESSLASALTREPFVISYNSGEVSFKLPKGTLPLDTHNSYRFIDHEVTLDSFTVYAQQEQGAWDKLIILEWRVGEDMHEKIVPESIICVNENISSLQSVLKFEEDHYLIKTLTSYVYLKKAIYSPITVYAEYGNSIMFDMIASDTTKTIVQ